MQLQRLSRWNIESLRHSPYSKCCDYYLLLSRFICVDAHLTADTALVTRSSNGVDIGPTCIQLGVHIRDLACQYRSSHIILAAIRCYLPCISWKVPTGLPNCLRSCMYSTAKSNAACMSLKSTCQKVISHSETRTGLPKRTTTEN